MQMQNPEWETLHNREMRSLSQISEKGNGEGEESLKSFKKQPTTYNLILFGLWCEQTNYEKTFMRQREILTPTAY